MSSNVLLVLFLDSVGVNSRSRGTNLVNVMFTHTRNCAGGKELRASEKKNRLRKD
jgi:hypothetical protein